MEDEIMDVASLANDITLLIMPFVSVLIMVVITLWFKDYAGKIAKGLAFSMNKQFQEGDKVILDGERALIVKIGITQTVFGVTKTSGEFDGDYVWRYVPNERIPFLKLEKEQLLLHLLEKNGFSYKDSLSIEVFKYDYDEGKYKPIKQED